MKNLKIKSKLILLFVLIKVIPLLLLAYIAIEGAKNLNNYFEETTKNTFLKSKDIISTTANKAILDSVQALDQKSQLAIERLSYEVANSVASFLYERDNDLLLLASIDLNQKTLDNFYQIKTAPISIHKEYQYNDLQKEWELKNENEKKSSTHIANIKDNEKEFNLNSVPIIQYKNLRLYKEIQVIDLNGNEIYKVSSLNDKKINIKNKSETYIKAENYFDDLQKLKKGEIYVSNVIGEYVRTAFIGTFTKEKAKENDIDFNPRQNAYAGKENPVGKQFEGIVRFATPIYKNNKKTGYVAFALDHRHIMEFTDSFNPLSENTKQDIADASSGNYAFMWDNKGRNISHARDYFIMGYDKSTGKQIPGWLSLDIAKKFEQSKEKDLNNFLKSYPIFENQTLQKKPNLAQLKNKQEIGLDCRYLNFAPQCEGWMQLTEDGGYGSFVIFWSGVWKLTTAAAIPYYSGQYANSKRGFGFITLGANVDEFHLAANETKENLNHIFDAQVKNMKQELDENKFKVMRYISDLTNELVAVTFLMVLVVIAIAIWMSNIVTNKIKNLLKGTKEYLKYNFNYRIDVTSKDEIGTLETSFNDMANEIKQLIDTQNNTNSLLDIKVKEANAASKAKSDFLASMSHEIRTPLNAILGFMGILKGNEKDQSNQKYYDIIETSGKNLLTIINDILDFSKIESDKIDLDNIQINLYDELHKIIEQFTKNSNTKNLQFITNISKNTNKNLIIDLGKITQVLNNLLSNAIKFSSQEGTVKIDIEYTIENRKLFVSVDNDGVEVAPEKYDLIFEAFSQEDNTTTRKYGGTGLGLAISKRFIELMNGTLKIDENRRNGARFYFEITLVQENQNLLNNHLCNTPKTDTNEQNSQNQDFIIENIDLLIVEDNPTNQMFMEALMNTLSIPFTIANNGQEAVELYKKNHYDIILMDENMPIMSGSEATIEIRKIEKITKKHTPIVALTASTHKDDKEKFLKSGMDNYLPKPFNKQDLLDMIEKSLKEHKNEI